VSVSKALRILERQQARLDGRVAAELDSNDAYESAEAIDDALVAIAELPECRACELIDAMVRSGVLKDGDASCRKHGVR
jgi:hypothetical protein